MYLQDAILAKVDRASMMHSLEVRAPYLDIEVVDFVRKIPARFKYKNGITKYIIKKSMEGLLPPEIIFRTKHGFGMPIGLWLKKGILNFNEELKNIGLQPEYSKKLYSEHISGQKDNRLGLWNMWLLGEYLQKM